MFSLSSSSSSSTSSSSLSPNSCAKYFRLGSATRRCSVIGCIGYENANPCPANSYVEKVDVAVGCDQNENNENNGNNDNNNSCAICLECIDSRSGGCGSQKNVATTECGHTFCLSCLLTNLRTSNLCPLCRTPIETNVKQILKPLSYSEGIGLLNHEINGLRIHQDIEQFVQYAVEVSSQPNTNGQNVQDVIDDIMNMVTNFGFNLLYDATLHTNNGEEQHMDQEWIIQMYNNGGDDSSSDDSSINDYNDSDSSDSDSEYESDTDSESGDQSVSGDNINENNQNNHDHDHDKPEKSVRVVLPEVPESMLN